MTRLEQIAEAIAPLVAERVAAQLADHLAELREAQATPAPEWIDAKAAAAMFGVSTDFLYQHADRLGAIRLGDGPKARLRFNPERISTALAAEPEPPKQAPPRRRPRPRSPVPLLEVKGGRTNA